MVLGDPGEPRNERRRGGAAMTRLYRFHLSRHDEACDEFEFESMAEAKAALEDWVANITESWVEEVSGG